MRSPAALAACVRFCEVHQSYYFLWTLVLFIQFFLTLQHSQQVGQP
jgi:hypothetical protein